MGRCIAGIIALGVVTTCFLSLPIVAGGPGALETSDGRRCGLLSDDTGVVGSDKGLWRTSVPCRTPLQTDCTSFEDIARLCPSTCPYAVQHAALTCVFECVHTSECSWANPAFAFPNNRTYACEPCDVVGCRQCSSKNVCEKCFDNFVLGLRGSLCVYVWDDKAAYGIHAGAAFCSLALLLIMATVVIIDRCLFCGRVLSTEEALGDQVDDDEASDDAVVEQQPATEGPISSRGAYVQVRNTSRWSSLDKPRKSRMSILQEFEKDPLERAINTGKRHRLRCKIKDLEVLREEMHSSPRATPETAHHAKVRSFRFWSDLRARFLIGVGLPLYHQWFPFLTAYSMLMAVGSFTVYHFSTFSAVLQFSGLDHASRVLFDARTTQQVMQESFRMCDISAGGVAVAAKDFAKRAAIGYFVLWLLALGLSLGHALRQRHVAAVFHRMHPCLAEFALNIEGFPPEAVDEDRIRRFLSEAFGCDSLEVSICYNFRNRRDRVYELFERVLEQEDLKVGAYDSELVSPRNNAANDQEHIGLTQADKIEVLSWLEPGATGGLQNGGSVFAVFPHFYDLQNAKQLLNNRSVNYKSGNSALASVDSEPEVPMLPHQATPEWVFLSEGPLVWEGDDGRMHTLAIRDVVCEPPDVVWENIGIGTSRFVCGFCMAVIAIVASFLAIAFCVFVPLARYSFTYVYEAGNLPTGVMMTVFGTLVMAANWVTCLLHIRISSFVGFTRRDREGLLLFKAFAVLCLVQFIFNVIIACFPQIASGTNPLRPFSSSLDAGLATLQDIAWQAEASVHLFHVLVPGGLYIGYLIWPLQGFVWPFLSTLGYLKCWHRRSWAKPLTARQAERLLEPLGVSLGHDYMGHLVQPVSCSFALFFASGTSWQIFICLAGWSLLMIPFQRYLHLRAVRRCYFTTNRLDTEALFGWGAALSIVLAASVFWAARYMQWPLQVVAFAWFAGVFVWVLLLMVVVRPMRLPKMDGHAANRPTYDQVRAWRFYDWHNCNPIKVLLSHCEGTQPISPFQVGKEYLQVRDPTWLSRVKVTDGSRKSMLQMNGVYEEQSSTSRLGIMVGHIPSMPEVETVIQRSMDFVSNMASPRAHRLRSAELHLRHTGETPVTSHRALLEEALESFTPASSPREVRF